jgi:hypothetical protein
MCEHLLRAMRNNHGSTDPVQRLAQRISLIISHDLEIYHIHPFATVALSQGQYLPLHSEVFPYVP